MKKIFEGMNLGFFYDNWDNSTISLSEVLKNHTVHIDVLTKKDVAYNLRAISIGLFLLKFVLLKGHCSDDWNKLWNVINNKMTYDFLSELKEPNRTKIYRIYSLMIKNLYWEKHAN